MNVQAAKKILEVAMHTSDSVLLSGAHGIGKSAIVRQFAKENDMHIEVLFLSTQEVADIIGNPYTVEIDGQTITKWSVPVWLLRMREAAKRGKRCVLFLDELNRATLDVRQSALPLTLEGRIHEHDLPVVGDHRTMVISAINPPGDYQVDELDPALMDRFLILDVEVDAPAWLAWARTAGVPMVIRDYIADNPQRLHWTPVEGITATPRSWEKLGEYINHADGAQGDQGTQGTQGTQKIPGEILYSIIKGRVGAEVGSQFFSFYRNYSRTIQVQDIEYIVDTDLSLDDAVAEIKDLMGDAEVIQRTELAQKLRDKYKDSDNMFPYVVYLYSLEMEVLTAFLHGIRTESHEEYHKLAEFDGQFNNKELFRRIVVAAHAN